MTVASRRKNYRPSAKPGAYVPTIVPSFSTVGATTPWVMTSGSQFRPEPPPALDSQTWTRDLTKSVKLGLATAPSVPQSRRRSAVLVPGGSPHLQSYVRQAALAKNMDVVDCARLFALASIAGNDALVAVFDAKYHYNLWRPITAIRNADITLTRRRRAKSHGFR